MGTETQRRKRTAKGEKTEKEGTETQRRKRTAKGGKTEKEGTETQRRKRTAKGGKTAKQKEKVEKVNPTVGMEIQTGKTQRKVWMSQLTTSFGVLIFHWSKFWKNVLRTR